MRLLIGVDSDTRACGLDSVSDGLQASAATTVMMTAARMHPPSLGDARGESY